MNVFFLLSILCLFGFFADENPDTTGQQSGDAAGAASGDADTGSIASLDDAMADATDEEIENLEILVQKLRDEKEELEQQVYELELKLEAALGVAAA